MTQRASTEADNPVYWAARHDNVPAIKALAESGVDIIKLSSKGEL